MSSQAVLCFVGRSEGELESLEDRSCAEAKKNEVAIANTLCHGCHAFNALHTSSYHGYILLRPA